MKDQARPPSTGSDPLSRDVQMGGVLLLLPFKPCFLETWYTRQIVRNGIERQIVRNGVYAKLTVAIQRSEGNPGSDHRTLVP